MKTSILLSPSFSPSIPTLYSQVDSQCRHPPKLYPHIVSTPTNLDICTDREEFLQYYQQPVTYAEAVYLPARRLAHIRRNIKFHLN
jgi:hypothetical protein